MKPPVLQEVKRPLRRPRWRRNAAMWPGYAVLVALVFWELFLR